MHSKKSVFLLSSAMLALAPVSSFAAGLEPATTRRGAAAYLFEKCPTEQDAAAQEAAGIAAVAASFAVDFIMKGIETYLAKRKAQLNGEFIAGTSTPDIYNIDNNNVQLSFGCLVVASGAFGADSVVDDKNNKSRLADDNGNLDQQNLKDLNLVDYPDFYIEMKASLIGSALTLQPSYLHYAKTSAQRAKSAKKNVVAVVGFTGKSLKPDAEINDENTFAIYRLNFGELEIGKYYEGKEIFTGVGAVQSLPAARQDGKIVPVPANIFVLVAETEDPSLGLELLTSAFESNKDDLSKALKDVLKDALGAEVEDS